MSNHSFGIEPEPPAARPAVALAGLVLLLLVFVIGLNVGQSGLLAPHAPAPVSSVPTPGPAVPDTSGIPGTPQPVVAPDNFDLFWQALDVVRKQFVGRDDLTDDQLTYGAIRGMIDALGDTGHSIFLPPEAVQTENESLGGEIVGVGILLGVREEQVIVVSVIGGGPADRAGIRTGDTIVAVDGEDVAGLAPEEVAPKVRGDPGTTVVLTVVRPATGERIDYSMERERLRFPAASWTLVPGTDIGLLRLIQFSTGSAAELRAARDAAIAAGAKSMILDLRSNPGGYVGEAVDVASLFLRQRTVYIRELANEERVPVLSNDTIAATDVPLVVLIDEGTASSAEIVSGALKSNERAELVGQTTFGTGTVLLTYGLTDGSAVRLAIERWLTPDAELIFGRGIEPTVEVALPADQVPLDPTDVSQLTPADVPQMPDSQLVRAIELLSR